MPSTKNPRLLPPSQWQKQRKIVTTIRLDPAIKLWAQSYAAWQGTDISTIINMNLFELRKKETFLHAPYMSNEKYQYYANMSDDADREQIKIEKYDSVEEMRVSYSA